MDEHHQFVERIDPLTGSGSLIAFLESFIAQLASLKSMDFSLLLVDLNNFEIFNQERGHSAGDEILHWVSIVMQDLHAPLYRIGGDEFVAVLMQGDHPERETTARDLFNRLNRESVQFSWQNPASVVLIHFQNQELEMADLWIAISDALFDVKIYEKRGFIVNNYSSLPGTNNYQMRVLNMLTERLLSYANRLDATHQIAHTDPVTQLPNSVAAEKEIKRLLHQSQRANDTFAVLFIDGDDLRLYNDISYSAGDNMLRRLSQLLTVHIRPGDFLARWRVGDEFVVLLPETSADAAMVVAERLRMAVEIESKSWEIPITISSGVSVYPNNGTTTDELLLAVEKAAKLAKDSGKNQIKVSEIEL